VAVGEAFPFSQPQVYAPQAGSDFRWPHVESGGKLCLQATRVLADAGLRVRDHLRWAIVLLNYDEHRCRSEFEREFVAYWGQRASKQRPIVVSLVRPGGVSREVVYVHDALRRRIVVAESKDELLQWLRNTGGNPGLREVLPTWHLGLERPWVPSEFPAIGRDVLDLLPEPVLRRSLLPDTLCPLLFEAQTPTGAAFVAVVLRGPTTKALIKGFRHLSRVPIQRVVDLFGSSDVLRCPVVRANGSWIHGREHDRDFQTLQARRVAIIGCGALGASLARLLAQSGIGNLHLVDGDNLQSGNISRHLLGMSDVGSNKAEATAGVLRRDFPHLSVVAYPKRFDQLSVKDLSCIEATDLMITAGISIDGDAQVNSWRRQLLQPPAHLCAWTEAFAVAGHAVLLYGSDSLMDGFDENERPVFRVTDWPSTAHTLVVEAGCGNVFQPHGVVDLQETVSLAAHLAVDALTGKVDASCRRVWLGDMTAVARHGGTTLAGFDASRVVRQFQWS
jgi:hypothetical protein